MNTSKFDSGVTQCDCRGETLVSCRPPSDKDTSRMSRMKISEQSREKSSCRCSPGGGGYAAFLRKYIFELDCVREKHEATAGRNVASNL